MLLIGSLGEDNRLRLQRADLKAFGRAKSGSCFLWCPKLLGRDSNAIGPGCKNLGNSVYQDVKIKAITFADLLNNVNFFTSEKERRNARIIK